MFNHTNLPIELKPKLVRDGIPNEIFKNEGVKAITKTLSDVEYRENLIAKLNEEVEELALSLKDQTNTEEEIADILEIIRAVADFSKLSLDQIETIRIKKFNLRGGFQKRIMLLGKEKHD